MNDLGAPPANDHELAALLATEAGKLLCEIRSELAEASESERKAAGDKRSHDFLMAALAAERPDDAVLSEEGADDPVRLRAERVWIVDPLDGTREFAELDRDDWAVHVALWQAGSEITDAAVALPALGELYRTDTVSADAMAALLLPWAISSRILVSLGVSHERSEVSPRIRPARSDKKNQLWRSMTPSGSGLFHPKNLPPLVNGMVNLPSVPLIAGPKLCDAPS